MTATTPSAPTSTSATAFPSTTSVRSTAAITTRVAAGIVGLALGAAAAMIATPWVLLAWLTPDVSLIGAFDKERRSLLKPSAVRRYNATHSMLGPLVMTVAGAAVLVVTPWVLAVGVLWFSHVLVDRACGYGLRAADGSQRG